MSEIVKLAFEAELVGGEAFQEQLERLVIHRPGLRKIERVVRRLERRHAAADAKLEAPAAHLIEHADFLDQAQWMIEGEEINQRPEAELLRSLR